MVQFQKIHFIYLLLPLMIFACSSDEMMVEDDMILEDDMIIVPMDTVECENEHLIQYANVYEDGHSEIYTLIYDDQNLPIQLAYEDTDTTLSAFQFYEYDSGGNITKRSSLIGEGLVTQIFSFEYEDGLRSKNIYETSISPGAPISHTQITYFTWENGRLMKIEQEQMNGIFSEGIFTYSNNDKTVKYDYSFLDGSSTQKITYYFNELIDPTEDIEVTFGHPVSIFALDSLTREFTSQTARTTCFQHEIDDQGRITKSFTKSFNSSEYILSREYYYDCLPE